MAQRRYIDAEPLLKLAFETLQRVLGKDHPNSIQSVNNLAALYISQRRYEEAQPLLKSALEACERVLGREHPQTLLTVNNLGELYRGQGRYDEAKPLLKRALEAGSGCSASSIQIRSIAPKI